MTKDETRQSLTGDVQQYRQKAKFYATLHMFEAEKFADRLADNVELALTTLPSDEDPQID